MKVWYRVHDNGLTRPRLLVAYEIETPDGPAVLYERGNTVDGVAVCARRFWPAAGQPGWYEDKGAAVKRVPDGLVCRFDGPQAWYDWLVATSLAGGFPAASPATPEEVLGRPGDPLFRCRYLTADGKQCAVGGLFDPADAGRLEAAMSGESPVDRDSRGWDRCLPPWLSARAAREVQWVHDAQLPPAAWSHARFVADLNELPLFADCVRAEAA